MKRKTVALLVLLIFTASAFAVTSTIPVMAVDSPTMDTVTVNFDGPPIQPCDPVPGGPNPPGD